ncbi:MAG: hypothetical protein A2X34_05250 [Elusimicrobia bacterium GWC2_51_8]|nr:MAG: hypothetical protein A2X33_05950 [Elusimicrobia bacterium GWA2_51_34]OGR58008.1 MAG: hypothetical protein A2X34_05250 [Elusimicrobia bacterium GWC2_51_8]OGR88188.1 MAG: hypothetical protein A2021_01090 [Elusimicrobia bacterium GWF2_52_66]
MLDRQPQENILKNKVSMTWDIHRLCNYHCPHCWFDGSWEAAKKDVIYLPPERWKDFWQHLYDHYGEIRVTIVGGEPFFYPGFTEIIKNISNIHRIMISTNGSLISDDFIRDVNPEKITIAISFYAYLASFDKTLATVKKLRKSNFAVGINYLAYPHPLQWNYDKIRLYRKIFKEAGCGWFFIASYWGKYDGRAYPDSYSPEDKAFILEDCLVPQRLAFSLKAESSKGRLCWAGGKYASISAGGRIYRCGTCGVEIGDVHNTPVQLSERPIACPVDDCKCGEYIPA